MRVGIAATVRRPIPEIATATLRHLMVATAALILLAGHAHAQVCRDQDAEQGSSGNPAANDPANPNPGAGAEGTSQYFVDCDMQYKNTELMCDTFKVRGSCPAEPMLMKETPNRSLIKDYSPYLYAYARDPDDRAKPYSGAYYRGTPGDAQQTFGLICPPGRRCPASCTAQIKFPSDARSPEEEAKMVRLQLDNCTNQYVLWSAMYPLQKENTFLLSGEDANDGSRRINLDTSCQPLKTVLDTKNEYSPTAYLRGAWIKLLKDPAYRMNPKAALEPHLPDNIRIETPQEPPNPFPEVRLTQLGAVKFEEINDPTHPFSPRWDFEFNERDHYSPMTQSYTHDPKNSVFCAGDKTQQILKVDILSFRETRLQFDDKITKRINFNKNCMANTGMQKNPCCKVQGLTCKLLPCAQCYGMTAASPVCSTDYTTLPDRKKVKVPYLPVHPALRVAGQLGGLASMSLSNLSSIAGGALNVAQASGLLSSQLNILSALPNGLSLGQALPLLGIQSNLLNSLSNLPSSITPGALAGIMASQTNLLSSLPGNLGAGQISALLNGQSLSLGQLGQAAGLPVNQVMNALESPRSLLSNLASQTPLGDIQHLVTSQMNVIDRFANQNLSVGDAARLVGVDLRSLENLPENMTLTQALSQGVRLTGVDLPGGISVRDARNILNSTNQGLAAFSSGDPASLLQTTVNSQLRAIANMPSGLPVGQVAGIMSSVQDVLRAPSTVAGLVSNTGALQVSGLTNVMSAVNGNINGINSIAGQLNSIGGLAGIDRNQLTSILGSNTSVLNSLGGSMGIQGIAGALQGQLASLQGLGSALPIGDVKSLLGSQLGSLSGLAGNLNLSSIAGGLDNQLLGSLPGLGGNLDLGKIPGLDLTGLAAQLPTAQFQSLVNSIPGLSSGQISDILGGKLSLGSIPGINGILSGLPNLNNIMAAGIPGLNDLLKGLPGTEVKQLPTLLVLAMYHPRTSKCNPNEFGSANSTPMAQLCRELRAPFTPMNKLKMRYHNPEEEDKIVLKDGVPEGYTFKEYFKDTTDPKLAAHMPYPRLWDTGRSIQRTASDDQDPRDDSGQWTTLVGVGHEATPGDAEPPSGDSREEKAKAQRMKDQRCKFGGWGGSASMGGVSIQIPDPVSSWTELKLYQTRTLRDMGLSCLGRYEKTVKLGSSEDRALLGMGGDPTQGIISKQNEDGTTTYSTVAQWLKDHTGGSDNKIDGISQMRQDNFPLAWRGYLSAKDSEQRFPNFPEGSGSTRTGLDNAEAGDIIIMENGASGENGAGKRGLPSLAIVTREFDKGTWIKVMEADAGKWPDVCGTTDNWGELKTRYLYKPGHLPSEAQHEYERIHSTSDCADTHLTQCEAKNWDSLKLYRPRSDIREGNDGSEIQTPPACNETSCGKKPRAAAPAAPAPAAPAPAGQKGG